jgi:hypothetical protein
MITKRSASLSDEDARLGDCSVPSVSSFVGRPVLKGAVKASVLQRADHMRDAATDSHLRNRMRRSACLMLIHNARARSSVLRVACRFVAFARNCNCSSVCRYVVSPFLH